MRELGCPFPFSSYVCQWCLQVYLEEGRRIREAAEVEKARLAAIKARKLKELEDAGVPGKYRAELEKYKLQIR